MFRNTAMVAVLALILIIAGWYLFRSKQSAPPSIPQSTETPAPTESASPSVGTEAAQVSDENLITITAAGFSPKDIVIKVGETVVWMNSDTIDHTVNSAPHPTHTSYPLLNLDNVKSGQKKSLTFPKAGTYRYHDHLNPSLTGLVTVQ